MNTSKKFFSQLLGATVYPDLTGYDVKQQYIFFYGGIFSQRAECEFIYKKLDEKVNCVEQAMMLQKAKFFNGNDEIYNAIKKAKHPREQKALGRMVTNYDDQTWAMLRYRFVREINYDKFSQNKAWKELLLLTDPYLLVEASPTDRIWGIGMGEDNPNLLETHKWGQNLLGQAITEVRNILMVE
jgi:ribA/ribD-fused uncharacterized protein